jgi:hypothetical protein
MCAQSGDDRREGRSATPDTSGNRECVWWRSGGLEWGLHRQYWSDLYGDKRVGSNEGCPVAWQSQAGDRSQGCGVGSQYVEVLVVKTGVKVGVGEAWP